MLDRMGVDKDGVMIIHMGGIFGDKEATLARFKENYLKLSDSIKARLVLENDEVRSASPSSRLRVPPRG